MTGVSRGQGVPLHDSQVPPPARGLHQPPINALWINYSRVHNSPSADELSCFRTLVMAQIRLQLAKSILWLGPIHTPGILWPERV